MRSFDRLRKNKQYAAGLGRFAAICRLAPCVVLGLAATSLPGCTRQTGEQVHDVAEAGSEDHVTLGQAYYREGDAQRAVSEFSLAIAANPQNVDLYNQRSDAYRRLGRSRLAFADLDKAVELEPNNPQLYLNRATAHEAQRDLSAAERDCDKAIALDPRMAVAYSLRAALRIEFERYDDAIADCDQAIRLDPQLAAAYNNRGLAYLKKNDYRQAIADSTRGIELHGETPEALVNRGVAYRALGEEEKALADWTAAIRVAPRHEPSYYNRAELLRKRGAWDKAIADYTILLEPRLEQLQARGTRNFATGPFRAPAPDTRTARLLLQRAAAYVGRGDSAALKQAVADCNLSVELNSSDLEAYQVRGAAYRALGEGAKADADLAHAAGRPR